jgi:hypothetical protein
MADGPAIAANRRVAFFRFAQRAAEKSFAKTLSVLPEERFLSVTAPVFAFNSRPVGSAPAETEKVGLGLPVAV